MDHLSWDKILHHIFNAKGLALFLIYLIWNCLIFHFFFGIFLKDWCLWLSKHVCLALKSSHYKNYFVHLLKCVPTAWLIKLHWLIYTSKYGCRVLRNPDLFSMKWKRSIDIRINETLVQDKRDGMEHLILSLLSGSTLEKLIAYVLRYTKK